MPDAVPDREAALRTLHREFAAGLPGRLATLRAALADCAHGFAPSAVDALYHGAHALQGTAASYAADELVEPARRLAGIGRRWRERAAGPIEHATAVLALRDLETAAASYRTRLESTVA